MVTKQIIKVSGTLADLETPENGGEELMSSSRRFYNPEHSRTREPWF